MTMRRSTRKLLSLLCALALVLGLLPVAAAVEPMPGEVAEIPLGDVGVMPALEPETATRPVEMLEPDEPADLLAANPDYIHNFGTQGNTTGGIYTGIAGSVVNTKGTATYNGLTIEKCLKMESSTKVTFNAPEQGTMILVFGLGGGESAAGKMVNLDGVKTTIPNDGVLRWENVTAGTHEVSKADTKVNLFYMEFAGSCTNHTYTKDKVLTAATCTTAGEGVKVCANCGKEGDKYVIDALGHDFAGRYTQTKAPTCSSSGTETATCSRCDAVDTKTIPATGLHEYEGGKCKNCGLNQGGTACTNHTMTEKPGTPATCTAPGEKVEECSVCGMTIKTPIPATGHDWTGEWEQTEDPTCTKKGTKTLTCKNGCGQTQTQSVPTVPHKDADGDGICDVCHNKLGEALLGAGGWFETMYVETSQFTPAQVTEVSWTGAMNGHMGPGNKFGYDMDYLVRTLNGKTRIDIPGVRAGDYTLNVVANGTTYTANVTVKAYDRSGYAHWNYTEGVGAYRDDGILKDEAIVLYVTEENKNTVELDIPDGTHVEGIGNILNSVGTESSENPGHCKRTSGNKVYWGICNDNQNALKKLADRDIPLVVRIIGKVSSEHPAPQSGGIDGLTAYDSYDYGGSPGDNGSMARMKDCKNITIEGIGPDACMDGWGIHFMASSATPTYGKNFEMRNIEFRNVPEDAVGMEGVQSGDKLTAPVTHCWVHNCEFYKPSITPAAESDKSEGDGACDFKRGEWFTMSYNIFDGCHKTTLLGSSDSSLQWNVTFHHNWNKSVQARSPLGRQANVHIYNNLYENQSDYTLNTRANCYIFSEYNVFSNCKNATAVEDGAIKSYNDAYVSCTIQNKGDPATIVTDKNQVVSSNNIYASFELKPEFSYIPDGDYLLDPSVGLARQNIMAYGGTMKAPEDVKDPEDFDASTIKPNRTKPTTPVALPYDADMTGAPTTANGVKDNIVFNISSISGSTVTFGKDTTGQYIMFLTDKVTDITMTPGGTDPISLVNADTMMTVATDGETAKNCPPGIYYIQPSNIQPDKNGGPAEYKSGKLTHLKITEVVNPPAVVTHTHSYTQEGGVVREATCVTEGAKKWLCPGCPENSFITKPIPVTDHVDTNPGDGFCDNCGLEMSVITPEDPDVPKIPVTGVAVTSAKTLDLLQGETAQITAEITPSNATNKALAYSSSDSAVARVGNKGLITAVTPGIAVITVMASDNCSDTVTVKVTGVTKEKYTFNAVDQGQQSADNNPAANGLKVGDQNFFTVTGANAVWRTKNKETDKSTASLQIGSQESSGLTFTIPQGSKAQDVTISFGSTGSNNYSAVALLDANGQPQLSLAENFLGWVKGTSGGKVTFQNLPAGTYTIVCPKDVNPRDVGLETWADPTNTSDPSNPNKRGARITTVTVVQVTSTGTTDYEPITAIHFAETELALTVGDVYTMKYTVEPANTSNETLTWVSSDPDVARVNKGIIRANKAGETIITARSLSDKVASCKVTVTLDPSQIVHITNINIVSADTVAVDGVITLAADVQPDNATCEVVWSVDDKTVAVINEQGELRGIKDGVVTVTATPPHSEDVTAEKVIIVGKGAPEQTLDGESRDLIWRYVPYTEKLTIEGMKAEDTVLAATYDANGRMTGVVELTMSEFTTQITKKAALIKLFWMNEAEKPMCEAATAWQAK